MMDSSRDTSQFRRLLAETAVWCNARLAQGYQLNSQSWRSRWNPHADDESLPAGLGNLLRSPELRPANLFEYELYSHLWKSWQEEVINDWRRDGSKQNWKMDKVKEQERHIIESQIVEHRHDTVSGVVSKRTRLLNEIGNYPEQVGIGTNDGRLLGYSPDQTLSEGASEAESNGFFDSNDVPAWDTWVCYHSDGDNDYLVSWVPASLTSIINDGIEVNSTDCIFWLDEKTEWG